MNQPSILFEANIENSSHFTIFTNIFSEKMNHKGRVSDLFVVSTPMLVALLSASLSAGKGYSLYPRSVHHEAY